MTQIWQQNWWSCPTDTWPPCQCPKPHASAYHRSLIIGNPGMVHDSWDKALWLRCEHDTLPTAYCFECIKNCCMQVACSLACRRCVIALRCNLRSDAAMNSQSSCTCVSVAVAKSAATVPSNRGSVAASWYSNVKLSAACLLQGCEQEGVVWFHKERQRS